MAMQEHFVHEVDNLFAASQIMPVDADSLQIAASQNLKRGSLLNSSGQLIAATVPGVQASGTATFSDQPTANDTLTVGETVLKFVSADPESGEVAIGADLAATLDNVIAAGRCISAESKPYASLRVQATLMSIGECAGVAASMASDINEAVHALPLDQLKKLIDERGCVL